MNKKVIVIFLLSGVLSGCYGYNDIEKTIFCTGIIIDVDENNNVVQYSELFHSFRSKEDNSEKGTRLIFSTKGKTLFEAIRNQNKSSSYKINYEQNKVIIFTKRAAEYGIDNFIDFLNRDQEFLLRQYIMIFEGDPKELIQLKIKQEEYTGLFIFDLVRSELIKDFVDIYQVYEYLNDRHLGNFLIVISSFRVKEEALQEDIIIDGAAIINEGKMIEKMEGEDAAVYSAMMGKSSTKIMLVPNPKNEENCMTLEILDKNLKTSIMYKDNKVILEKKFNIRVSLAESEKPIELDNPEIIKEIEKTAEEGAKKLCIDLFEKYKEKNLDIFRIEEMLSRKYPFENIKNPINITELKVTVDMRLEGSTDILDYE